MIHRMSFLCVLLMVLLPLQVSAVGKLSVYSVNYPLHYFAERIGGDRVKAVFPAPQDVDPAFWSPDRNIIKEYQAADIILLNGAGYARWTNKVSLPMLRTVDTSKKFRDSYIHIESTVTHSHGPGGDHSHGGTAFTTWLDFSQAAKQAKAVYRALARLDPVHGEYYKDNFSRLESDLLYLDSRMEELCSGKTVRRFFASHPIYQYMARRYKIDILMMMWEPETDPGESEWKKLKRLYPEHPAQMMIWEETPLPESIQRLTQMSIQGVVFQPCFSEPTEGDFLTVMKKNLHDFGEVLQAAQEND